MAISCDDQCNQHCYDGVIGTVYNKLSQNGRLKLDRTFDAYGAFEVICFPGEKVKRVTLYTEESVEGKQVFQHIKTVKNVEGKFSFFDTMFLYRNYEFPLFIEVEFEKSMRNFGDNVPFCPMVGYEGISLKLNKLSLLPVSF